MTSYVKWIESGNSGHLILVSHIFFMNSCMETLLSVEFQTTSCNMNDGLLNIVMVGTEVKHLVLYIFQRKCNLLLHPFNFATPGQSY